MQILVATTNEHKLDEMRAILLPIGIEVVGLDSIIRVGGTDGSEAGEVAGKVAGKVGGKVAGEVGGGIPEPIEDADSFAGNARIKAKYYAEALERMCLADDSGLVVDALNGEPGVYSARYAGVEGSREERDRANNEKLLRKLAALGIPERARRARFVCAMCLVGVSGRILAETAGEFSGLITDKPRGANGFGYDPLLYLPKLGKTSAELSPAEKNRRSHRGAAARAMAERIASLGLC